MDSTIEYPPRSGANKLEIIISLFSNKLACSFKKCDSDTIKASNT